jgi:hypothetical protein
MKEHEIIFKKSLPQIKNHYKIGLTRLSVFRSTHNFCSRCSVVKLPRYRENKTLFSESFQFFYTCISSVLSPQIPAHWTPIPVFERCTLIKPTCCALGLRNYPSLSRFAVSHESSITFTLTPNCKNSHLTTSHSAVFKQMSLYTRNTKYHSVTLVRWFNYFLTNQS